MFLQVPSKSPSIIPSPLVSQNRTVSMRSITVNPKQSATSLLTQSKQQLSTLQSIQNGFYVANLYKRFLLIDKVLFVLILLNCVGIAVYLELEIQLIQPLTHKSSVNLVTDEQHIDQIKTQTNIILWMNLILTLLSIPVSFFRHTLQTNYEKVQKKLLPTYFQAIETTVLIIQPLPFLEQITIAMPIQLQQQGPIQIKLNLCLVIASVVKCLLLARYMFWHDLCRILDLKSQKFFKPSYNRICKIYTCQNSYLHIMKCLFQENFIVFIGGFYLICMTTSAYCLRITESHFDGRFNNLANCLWFALLSMTTIGYGEIFVSTPIGIAIDCFLMFSGVVISSLLVSSLNDLFSMGYRQKRSLTLLKRLRDKAELKQIAGLFIVRHLERRFLERKLKMKLKISEQQRRYCRLFHELRMILRCGKEKQLNLYRDMSNQFESLKLQLDELMDTCEADIQTLSQKQRLTLNRDSRRSSNLRNRSSSYLNMIKLKSRDSRVSLMQPIFNNEFLQMNQKGIHNNTCKNIDSETQKTSSDSDSSQSLR